MSTRTIERIIQAQAVTDGAGVKINRSVAHKKLGSFDPFLLLDEIKADDADDYIGGFPEHPHRGFETVTYMLQGRMRHRDHMGNEGLLESGSVQWMSAGKGVLHSEMPEQEEGAMHGFQLWINLPAKDKMKPARYQEYAPEQIPTAEFGQGSAVKVIAGEVGLEQRYVGPVAAVNTQPLYLDLHLAAGDEFSLPIAQGKQAITYLYQGEVEIAGKALAEQQLASLSDGEQLSIRAESDSRMLILAAYPIKEPIANWGPFVMNTWQEIEQAIADYNNGELV